MARFEFRKDFYWGSATSAHQVEGNNHNDWSEWEKENANRLVSEASKKISPPYLLAEATHQALQAGEGGARVGLEATDPSNYLSGQACDHYNRFREDFDIAKSLGHNAHRFSIEWSRVEQEEGKWDEKEIRHYQEVINALREHGLEPFVTLWHWTSPIWIAKQGGWENPKTIEYFSRYVDKIVRSLKSVAYWITLNEP